MLTLFEGRQFGRDMLGSSSFSLSLGIQSERIQSWKIKGLGQLEAN